MQSDRFAMAGKAQLTGQERERDGGDAVQDHGHAQETQQVGDLGRVEQGGDPWRQRDEPRRGDERQRQDEEKDAVAEAGPDVLLLDQHLSNGVAAEIRRNRGEDGGERDQAELLRRQQPGEHEKDGEVRALARPAV
jgi:hypothetical protein